MFMPERPPRTQPVTINVLYEVSSSVVLRIVPQARVAMVDFSENPYRAGLDFHLTLVSPVEVSAEKLHVIREDLKEEYTRLVGRDCSNRFISVILSLEIQPVLRDMEFKITFAKEENKMLNLSVPDVVEIVHRTSKRGEFFTVKWSDNTETTVKLMEGDTSDEYTAFLFAMGKKMFGDKGVARKFVREKKQVFERRIEAQSTTKKRLRAVREAEKKALSGGDRDVQNEVYNSGFLPPCALANAMFKSTGRTKKPTMRQED